MFHKTPGLFAALLLLGLLALGGCNTTQGFGKDVEALGDTIEDKATQEKAY